MGLINRSAREEVVDSFELEESEERFAETEAGGGIN